MKVHFLLMLVLISANLSFAQSKPKKDKKKIEKVEIDRGATYEVGSEKVKKKKVKHSMSKEFDRKVEEYEKRMIQNARNSEKMAREMKKPQYADPTYFGHKKKPKKRPPGKKKFCKECQMYH